MRYKEDWEASRKRLEAFWHQEVLDRCCAAVYVYENGAKAPERVVPGDDAERLAYWTDPTRVIERERRRMENTYFGGEAFPSIFVDLGAAGHAGFFKGEKHYFGDSVWFFPSLEDPNELEFDENSFLYKKTLELARAYAEDSKGDYLISMPDTSGNADALSHLMGPENLLPAMLEDPDGVKDALGKIQAAYERIMREVYGIVKDVNGGGCCIQWLSTFAPGLHAQMQCDMSVMISNAMYEEFIMPELRAQCDLLDEALYHFDGVEQIRHLDSLLSIERLRAIQWTQVAGQPPCTEYFPELRKIQAAGKSLLILVSPGQVQPIMENLSSKGLYLITNANSREEADALMKNIAKWTHD